MTDERGAPPAGADGTGGWPHELDEEYEFKGELGRGGMAVVYRAREKSLGRDVAIKVVRPRFHSDEESVARLAREARTVAQLEHPNIVSLHAVKRLANGLALVMQLVPGQTLKAALTHAPLSADDATHVLRDIARALAYAHRCGVVHRDVKPENIFIDEVTGRALLSDFGVARSIEENTELTATGTAIGTPTYMSPEQIDGGHLDGRSDLYSLGMVGWEMLTGQRPWAGESLYSVIYRQKHDPLPALDGIRPDVPQRLQYLIEGLMHKNPDRRWASAARFLALLASDETIPGFKEWQSSLKKRRRTGTQRAATPRSGSPVGVAAVAANSTVRFRRGEPGDPSPSDLQAITIADPDATQRLRSTPSGGGHTALEEPPVAEPISHRRRPWMIGGSVAMLAAIAYLWLARPFSPPMRPADGPAVFADAPQVVVPPVVTTDSVAAAGVTALDSLVTPPGEARRDDSLSTGATSPADSARVASAASPPLPTRRDSLAALAARGARTQPVAPAGSTTASQSVVPPRTPPPSPPPVAPVAASTTLPTPPAAGSRPLGAPVSFAAERGTIAAGGRHSCQLDEAGRARCWGNNERGQLGDGTFDTHPTPTAVAGDMGWAMISAGVWHTCAVQRDGDAFCWGSNDAGQLGDGSTASRATPTRVTGSGGFRVIRSGSAHTCGLTRAGTVLCWGANSRGQVGDGARATRTAPVVVALGSSAGAVTVGRSHSCALAVDGMAFCWGQNDGGQLGDGSSTDRATPTPVATDHRFVAIAAGSAHTCAIDTEGSAWCWGKNPFGQLGNGSTADASTPQRVETQGSFSTITAGQLHSCGRTRDGRALCWGRNTHGQLGDGSTTDRTRPVAVRGNAPFVAINASGAHTCGLTAGGEGFCWGYNIDGQLGGGDRDNSSLPSKVGGTDR